MVHRIHVDGDDAVVGHAGGIHAFRLLGSAAAGTYHETPAADPKTVPPGAPPAPKPNEKRPDGWSVQRRSIPA
ncbi:MAG: hypothetical protein ACK559_21290, partial [bacterium]